MHAYAALRRRHGGRRDYARAVLERDGRQPGIAVEAARQTALELATHTFRLARTRLGHAADKATHKAADKEADTQRRELSDAMRTTREYVQAVRTDAGTPGVYREHVGVLHALDHLARLTEALSEDARAALVLTLDSAREVRHELSLRLEDAIGWLANPEQDDLTPLERASHHLAEFRRQGRHDLLSRVATGELTADAAERMLEALRWLDRIGYHAFRAMVHLERANHGEPTFEVASDARPPSADESYEVLP